MTGKPRHGRRSLMADSYEYRSVNGGQQIMADTIFRMIDQSQDGVVSREELEDFFFTR